MLLLVAMLLVVTPEVGPEDAREIDRLIAAHYAYLDDLPEDRLPRSTALDEAADTVADGRDLLAYAEARLHSLGDHHAHANSSFADSWALIPTYSDLWVEEQGGRAIVTAVRDPSPARRIGIRRGDELTHVGDMPVDEALAAMWAYVGTTLDPARRDYALRTLAAGRRDRDRVLTIRRAEGEPVRYRLPSLYDQPQADRPPIEVTRATECIAVRFNNRLGDSATVEAFDALMSTLSGKERVILDLRDTPSGGNTSVARAILGWFVDRQRGYQLHDRPDEFRRNGVERRWLEFVMPRAGKFHPRLPLIRVGRWTGSMGEGIAIGFDALGSLVVGEPMAGLKGSVETVRVGETGLSFTLPTERLFTVDGLPREHFVPENEAAVAGLECA